MTRQAVQTLDCSLTRRTGGIVPVVVAASSVPHDHTGDPRLANGRMEAPAQRANPGDRCFGWDPGLAGLTT